MAQEFVMKPRRPEEQSGSRRPPESGNGASREQASAEIARIMAGVTDSDAGVQKVLRETRINQVLEEFDRDLVALAPVKQRIREIAALLVIDLLRRDEGLSSDRPSLHMCFTGSVGTGKTTVAAQMAQILNRIGLLDGGHLVSVTRDDLVGQYVGHTAPKTKEVLKRAYGGVLFIDEAYHLHRPENERDYGPEAIEILLQVMESDRDRLVVILAGYKDRMAQFFASNPGMGSRVAHHVDFPDYTVDQLMQIARLMVARQAYTFAPEAETAFREYLTREMSRPLFANGRSVRNAIDRARLSQANRLFTRDDPLDRQALVTIEADDIRHSSAPEDGLPQGETEKE